jgi:hypothetical protein
MHADSIPVNNIRSTTRTTSIWEFARRVRVQNHQISLVDPLLLRWMCMLLLSFTAKQPKDMKQQQERTAAVWEFVCKEGWYNNNIGKSLTGGSTASDACICWFYCKGYQIILVHHWWISYCWCIHMHIIFLSTTKSETTTRVLLLCENFICTSIPVKFCILYRWYNIIGISLMYPLLLIACACMQIIFIPINQKIWNNNKNCCSVWQLLFDVHTSCKLIKC